MHKLVSRWENLPLETPLPGIDRRRVIGEHAMISQLTLKEGSTVQAHAHPNEQFTIVVAGKLRFELGEPGSAELETVDVTGGEVLHLPSNLKHSAIAMEDTTVFDIFSPPSESTGIDN
jgi:quercetin dioxygenase-like cupin family protein